MSLIVGCATPDIGFLVADTLLSLPNQQYDPRKPEIEKFHVLKIQVVAEDIGVSFAGDVEPSLEIIRRLQKELAFDPSLSAPQRLHNLFREFLVETSGLSQCDCEFLVLTLKPEQKTLARVTRNEIQYFRRAYIGDPAEYRRFRSLTRDYDGPERRLLRHSDGTFQDVVVTGGEKEFGQVSAAMERLTHQRNAGTVGAICGCITRVVDARISRKLEYMQSGERGISPAEGVTGFSLLASNSGTRGIGIYYYGWNAGLVFVVGDSVPCRKEAAATIKEFIEVAESKYGLMLEGALW